MERSQVSVVLLRTILTCPVQTKRCCDPSIRPLSQSTNTGFSGVASGVRPESLALGAPREDLPGGGAATAFPATDFWPGAGCFEEDVCADAFDTPRSSAPRIQARPAPQLPIRRPGAVVCRVPHHDQLRGASLTRDASFPPHQRE